MVEVLNHHPEIKTLASSFNFVDGQGKPFSIEQKKGYSNQNLLHKDVINEIERVDLSLVKITNFSQGCCMAVRKEEVEIFLKNTQSKYPHDWELNLIAAMQDGCYFYNVPLIDYRIHDKNTIGLDDVIHNSRKELMKNRTIKRLNYINEEIELLNYLKRINIGYEYNKEYVDNHILYSKDRKKYIKNKSFFSLIVMYLKGKYKGYGSFKTFVGDLCSIVYK